MMRHPNLRNSIGNSSGFDIRDQATRHMFGVGTYHACMRDGVRYRVQGFRILCMCVPVHVRTV